jgi:hypothetical protein
MEMAFLFMITHLVTRLNKIAVVLLGTGLLSLPLTKAQANQEPSDPGKELTISDLKGQTLVGTITEANQREFSFLVNGRVMKIPLAVLSGDSREKVLETAKAEGKYDAFPELRIQVTVGTKRRQGDAWYVKQMEISPKFVIEAQSMMDSIPPAEAVMIIITMDTREKYVRRVEKFTVEAAETIKIPAADSGKRRDFAFEPTFVDYDMYRDHTNVGGKVYRYFIFGLVDPETDYVLDFQTNCQNLSKYVAAHPGKRKEFLKLRKGDPFEDKF